MNGIGKDAIIPNKNKSPKSEGNSFFPVLIFNANSPVYIVTKELKLVTIATIYDRSI